MKHGLRLGCVAVLAGMTLAGGAEVSHAASWGAVRLGMYGAAMGGSHGRGSNGYLGIETRDVADDEVSTLKLKEARGAEIINVDHDGPACKSGIQMHDVILQMNGQVIEGEDQLRRMLRETPAGRTITVVVSRDGQTLTLTTQMADRRTVGLQAWGQHYTVPDPASASNSTGYGIQGSGFMASGGPSITAPAPKGHRDFLATSMILSASFTGAQLELMGPQLAQYFGAETGAGLLVRSVDRNSPAEIAGLRAGDVVVQINSIPVANETDWTKTVRENKGRPLPVVVLRDKREQTLTLTPDGKKRSAVKPGLGLEEFFEGTSQYTRELLAKL